MKIILLLTLLAIATPAGAVWNVTQTKDKMTDKTVLIARTSAQSESRSTKYEITMRCESGQYPTIELSTFDQKGTAPYTRS